MNETEIQAAPSAAVGPRIIETHEQLRIIYEDEDLVAVYKPAGILTHRSKIASDATSDALNMARELCKSPLYLAHRLDRATSGLLLFSRSPEAARALNEAFTKRQIQKTYWAVLRGWTADEGHIDYPLAEVLDRKTDRRARKDKAPAEARTAFQCLGRVERSIPVRPYTTSRYSLVEAWPETGRKHQLRRHFKHIFHPIIGDTTWGDGHHNRAFESSFALRRLWLCARKLQFPHPGHGGSIALTAPLSEEWLQLLQILGWADQASRTVRSRDKTIETS